MSISLILVGPMGVGKTTIGRLLAKETGLPFLDVDHEVEANAGANIPWIFDVEGEQGFRRREHQALKDCLESGPAVIATGGGIVTQEDNRLLLSRQKGVIYLYATVDQLFERTYKDKNRPLLQTEDPRSVLEKLLQEREPYYQSLAGLKVSTESSKPKAVVDEIVSYWKNH